MEKNFLMDGVSGGKILPGLESKFHQEMRTTVWIILSEIRPGVTNFSGGVCINSTGLVLTTGHSVLHKDDGCRIRGSSFNNLCHKPSELVLVSYDKELDLALLRVKQDQPKGFDFAIISEDSQVLCGKNLYSISHLPPPGIFSFVTGYNSSSSSIWRVNKGTKPHLIRICYLSNGGSSGCPAFGATGKLVGINTCDNRDHTLAIPVASIREFLGAISTTSDGSNYLLEGDRFVACDN